MNDYATITNRKRKFLVPSDGDSVDVPIVLLSENVEPSIFLETLLTGAILPNPFNHTGWYVIGDLPEVVPNTYIFWLRVCNFLGRSFRHPVFLVYITARE